MSLARFIRLIVLAILALDASPLRAQEPPPAPPSGPGCAPVTGMADLHLHQFSNLAFGRRVLHGEAYVPPPLGIQHALAPCGDPDIACIPPDLVDECIAVCSAVSGVCGDLCDFVSGACFVGCDIEFGACNTGCDIVCTGCSIPCIDPTSAACRDCQRTCNDCRRACADERNRCRASCQLDCDACRLPCEEGCRDAQCIGGPHGPYGITDLIGKAQGEGVLGHDTLGWPDFTGWPKAITQTHQQVYSDWLLRAHQGGLNLVSMLAVNNELLCELQGAAPGATCDTMAAADAQIAAARAMERSIDLADDGLINESGWYRIAESPAEARRIIADGDLAVVLGLELDRLFGCGVGVPCSESFARSELRRYYNLGVRQFFPVHVFDNAFGGTAVDDFMFEFGNLVENGDTFDVFECAPFGYEYNLGTESVVANALLTALAALRGESVDLSRFASFTATCNARGLTPLGEALIDEAFDLGMIVDVDHMSYRMRDRVLQIAEERGYSAIVRSHCTFTELGHKDEHETSASELARINALGGLVAPILHGPQDNGGYDPVGDWPAIANDCPNSSKNWAQEYLYAVDHGATAVALGTDFNGMAAKPGPRHGPDACNGEPHPPQTAVSYPFALHDSVGGTMGRSTAGTRTFDINTDGIAHIGLLPDFVADLRAAGLSDRDLDPLFSAAEAYIALWERVANEPPAVQLGGAITVGEGAAIPGGTFTDGDCDDDWTAVADFGDGTSGAVTLAGTSFTLDHPYADNGTYTLRVTVTDARGATGASTRQITVLNRAPVLTLGATVVADEGALVALPGATFTDPGTRDTHVATVNWGDGTGVTPATVSETPFGPPGSTAGMSGSVAATHVYADNGTYSAQVCVTDDDGASHCRTTLVTIRNVVPTVDAGADRTVAEGTVIATAPAAFHDAGTLDTHVATINWGDGTASGAGVVSESPFGPPGSLSGLDGTVLGNHVYADNGAYTVTVCVADDDGAAACDALVVTVTNVAPTLNAGPDVATFEGDVVSLPPASFGDAGTLDTHSATVDWGDGTPVAAAPVTEAPYGPPGSTAGMTGTVAGSHVYADNGTYRVRTCVTDDDGATTCDDVTVVAANRAPVLSPFAGAALVESGTYTLSGLTFSDRGTLDTHVVTIDWADRSPVASAPVVESPFGPPGSTAGASGSVPPQPRTYGDDGAYVVRACVTDDDGASDCKTAVVSVATVVPELVLADPGVRPFLGEDGPAILARRGVEVPFAADGRDVGSDDLRFAWTHPPRSAEVDPASVIDPEPTRTHANDGSAPVPGGAFTDLAPSSLETVFPFAARDDARATFTVHGIADTTVEATDDDGGRTVVSTPILVTDDRACTNVSAQWEHHLAGRGQAREPFLLRRDVEVESFASAYFSEVRRAGTVEEALAVFTRRGGGRRAATEREALAAWLNFAAGGVLWDEPLRDGMPVSTALQAIDAVLLDAGASDTSLREAEQLARSINTLHAGGPGCE